MPHLRLGGLEVKVANICGGSKWRYEGMKNEETVTEFRICLIPFQLAAIGNVDSIVPWSWVAETSMANDARYRMTRNELRTCGLMRLNEICMKWMMQKLDNIPRCSAWKKGRIITGEVKFTKYHDFFLVFLFLGKTGVCNECNRKV